MAALVTKAEAAAQASRVAPPPPVATTPVQQRHSPTAAANGKLFLLYGRRAVKVRFRMTPFLRRTCLDTQFARLLTKQSSILSGKCVVCGEWICWFSSRENMEYLIVVLWTSARDFSIDTPSFFCDNAERAAFSAAPPPDPETPLCLD